MGDAWKEQEREGDETKFLAQRRKGAKENRRKTFAPLRLCARCSLCFHSGLNSGVMVCRYGCAGRWRCPESQSEKPGKGFRSFAESSTGPGLLRRPDESRCPSRYGGPNASARE